MKSIRDVAYGQEKEPLLESVLAVFRYSHTIRFLKEIARDRKLIGIDAGCGHNGEFVNKVNIAIPNIRFYGCDIKVTPADKSLFICNIDDISAVAIKPDIVVMHAVMEHLEDPVKTLQDVHSLLQREGIL